MQGVKLVLQLLSGVALFLFGMSLMGDGLKKVAGSKMEMVLWKLTNNPIKSVLLGAVVTAVIQSSSATSIMVIGFVNSGIMTLSQAIGIIMGAILGTSVTGWIISLSSVEGMEGAGSILSLLSTSNITAVVAIVGIVIRMVSKSQEKKHIGDILLGFAILMFGMSSMSDAVAPLQKNAGFVNLLTSFSNPVLGIIVGLLFTTILQSASASTGILQALSKTGAISFSVAFPIIMGIGIGAACPVLISSVGANKNGKRTSLIYLLIDVLGAILCSILFYGANAIFHFAFLDATMNPVTIALLNTLFRLATIILVMPLAKLLEKFIVTVIPDDPAAENENAEIDRLEERFIAHPALAIEQSRIALNSMARKAKKNLYRSIDMLSNYSEERYRKIQEKEDVIDTYEDKLGSYLVQLTGKEMTKSQNREVSKILHTMSDFERIGDHAVNITECAKELNQKHIVFSDEAEDELELLTRAIHEIVDITTEAFEKEDVNLAYRVEPLEEMIDLLCDEMKMRHIARIQRGTCTLNHGFVFNDLLTNYERVADHCSNVAVAMIELDQAVATFDTHEYLNNLKKIKDSTFNQYFEEYRNKYQL
ncbi:MAG: Na/Pi cotransporter family protein [Lachnospiraceae bacterium]|nr:Na/Pi cotransporter family protein [Lachnospiraceae bacterium]